MSAVDDYRAEADTHGDEWRSIHLSLADAAIAELEAENEKAVAFGQGCVAAGAGWMKRAEQAEAELAALKLWQEYAQEQMSDSALREVERRWAERGTLKGRLNAVELAALKGRLNAVELAALKGRLKQVLEVGHNNDCLFCALKDTAALGGREAAASYVAREAERGMPT